MSQLGELVRLTPAHLAYLAGDPSTAWREVQNFKVPSCLELDWEWKPFGILFDAAGFGVNPFRPRSGTPFPDLEHAFGAGGDADSRALRPDEVAELATSLAQNSFASLTPLLRPALVEYKTLWFDYDYRSPTHGQRLPPDRVVPAVISDEAFESYRVRLADAYAELTDFYGMAAHDGQCTVFWAA